MSNPNDRPSQFFPHESDPAWPFRHVGLFCDRRCGAEIDGDFRADDLDQAYAALRTHATAHDWTITDTEDVCPRCTLIEEMRVFVEEVRRNLTLSATDWGTGRIEAGLYGIFAGWSDDTWQELAVRHGWTPEMVTQLRRHNNTVERLLTVAQEGTR